MPDQKYPLLAHEVRYAISTDAAAFHLNRKPQTLQKWACRGNGPIKPIHVSGRLAWRVEDIRRLLGVIDS